MTLTTITPPPVPCPVRGHDHNLQKYGSTIHQQGTDSTAQWWECPTGNYRWFLVNKIGPSKWNRFERPRWGWKDEK